MATDLNNGYKTKYVYRAPEPPPAPYGSSFAPTPVVRKTEKPPAIRSRYDGMLTATPSHLGVRRRKRH